jgi:hypothetical protein
MWTRKQRRVGRFRALAVVAFAVSMAISVFEIPVFTFENGIRFHALSLLSAMVFAVPFALIIFALQRFTPLLSLPRHHPKDSGGDSLNENERSGQPS